MTIQAILSLDGDVLAAEDFPSEAAAVKWAESFSNEDHYLVHLFKGAEDEPYAEYIVGSRFGIRM